MADELPEGFTIDEPSDAGLPPGFTIDQTQPTSMEHLKSAVTDIPSEIYQAGKSAVGAIGETFNPYSESNKAKMEAVRREGFTGGLGSEFGTVGRSLLGVPELVGSPVTGTGRSVIGHALAAAPGGESYEKEKEKADLALMGLGARGAVRAPMPTAPARPPLGVTLSEGQASGDLAAIQAEQAALRNAAGRGAYDRAQRFGAQQEAELEAAKGDVAQGLHPQGQVIAQTPQEAGQLVSSGVTNARDFARGQVDAAYTTARSLPGEIHAGAFEGIGQKIKGDLSLRQDPIIVSDKLTPHASEALQYLDNQVSNLRIQNRADPFGQPNPESITGVSLNGVEQWRKNLVAYRRQAFGSGNASDGRAMREVVRAFDNQVGNAVNNGLFTGDPAAIAAFNNARRLHANYSDVFTAGRGDPVGSAVEKILGRGDVPAALPDQVLDLLHGPAGQRPTAVNVATVRHVRDILGANSDEWVAAKQGLWQRLVETPQGAADMGPGRLRTRLAEFLNGRGRALAEQMYAPHELAVMRDYMNIMERIQVPQGGANWSNTGPLLVNATRRVGSTLGMVVGAFLGRQMGLPHFIGEAAGAATAKVVGKIPDLVQARQIRRQMPIVAQQLRQYQRAILAAQRAGTPPSRAIAMAAGNNLARSLAEILGTRAPVTAGHSERDENAAQGPVNERQHGGQVSQQHAPRILRATGGRVKSLFHPVQIGAKRARDGKWYVSDPDRPGKWMEVRRHG